MLVSEYMQLIYCSIQKNKWEVVPNKILFPIIIYVEVGEQLWISLHAFLMFHSFAVFNVILAAHSSQLVAPPPSHGH